MDDPRLGVDMDGPGLRVNYQGDLAVISGKENLRAAMLRRLNTPLGGLFSHPEYGNPVVDILSDPMDEAWAGKVVAGIRQCLEQEPRITVESVEIASYPEDRQAVFNIKYHILDEPGTENLVWSK